MRLLLEAVSLNIIRNLSNRKFLIFFWFFDLAIEAKAVENWVWIPSTEDGGRTKVSLAEIEAQAQPYFHVTDDVTFELFTLKNPYNAQIISPSNLTSITDSNLNPNVPTRISIHGWQERGAMRKAFLDGKFTVSERTRNF